MLVIQWETINFYRFRNDKSMIIWYGNNGVVIIDQEENPKGTRTFGAIIRELRLLNFTEIVSFSLEVI